MGTTPEASPLSIRRADLSDPRDADGVLQLLDAFAREPVSGGQPLADPVRARLLPGLREHPTSLVWLAFLGDDPIGIVVAFVGFSTFKARPLVNLHDVAVLPAARGKGVGRALLAAVEEHARAIGCCKLTLEVLEENQPARGLYESLGFRNRVENERSLFYAKTLVTED